jgi:hypothetical protein
LKVTDRPITAVPAVRQGQDRLRSPHVPVVRQVTDGLDAKRLRQASAARWGSPKAATGASTSSANLATSDSSSSEDRWTSGSSATVASYRRRALLVSKSQVGEAATADAAALVWLFPAMSVG